MKYRFLAVISLFFLFSLATFGQEREFDLKVSLEDTSIDKNSDEVFATITITNKSDQVLKAEGLGFVEIRFSKVMPGSQSGLIKNDYFARVDIPQKKLPENKSLEFRINLVEQKWFSSDPRSGKSEVGTDFNKIPEENIFFYADIKMLAGYRNTANPKTVYKNGKPVSEPIRKRPFYKTVNSNLVTVTLN